jgi:hypothetical protein
MAVAKSGASGGRITVRASSSSSEDSNPSEILVLFPDAGDKAGSAISQTVWAQNVANWQDPFTPPHSRAECVKWAYPWPGSKVCVGWKVQWQYMYGHLWIVITLATPGDIAAAITAALRDATVAAALAAVVTAFTTDGAAAGAAAASTFEEVFESDLAARIAEKIISVDVQNRAAWGSWQ